MIHSIYSNHPNLDDSFHLLKSCKFGLFISFLTFPKESPKASLKYDGIHVSRVYAPQLLQKCAIIIAHTAGDVIICNHGVESCVKIIIMHHHTFENVCNHGIGSCEKVLCKIIIYTIFISLILNA